MSEEAKKNVELTTSEKMAAEILGLAANLGVSVLIGFGTGALLSMIKGHKIMQFLSVIGSVGLSWKLGDEVDEVTQEKMKEIFGAIEKMKLAGKKIAEAKAKKETVQAEGEIA